MTSYNLPGPLEPSHVVRRGIRFLALCVGVLCMSSFEMSGISFAKTPGKTYCYKKTCHRVKTLNETKALVGRDLKINASYYDGCSKDRFNSCGLTSSGEVYKPHKADNAASSVLPDGTIALVWSQISGEAIVLRINNAGPYWGNRKLDLSAAAARKLGVKGVEEVTLRVVKAPTEDEARFEKNRSYDPVIGPLGKFASLELAQKALSKIRADGLKGLPSLASLEDPIPTSGSEVTVASLDETFYLKTLTVEEGGRFQSVGAETVEDANNFFSSSQSILTSLSRVKDLLSNLKPQILLSGSENELIEKAPLDIKSVATSRYKTNDLAQVSSVLENTETKPIANKEASLNVSNELSKEVLKGKAKGTGENNVLLSKTKLNEKSSRPSKGNVGRSNSSQIKISSLNTETADKFASPKAKKKSS